jgi:PAS domain S-box-containing protein
LPLRESRSYNWDETQFMRLENPASSAESLESLRAVVGKMEVALGATTDAVAWTDEKGVLQWCNTQFDRLVGRPHMSVLGQDIRRALPLDRWSTQPRPHPASAVLETRTFVSETVEIERAGERRHLDFFGSWVQGGGIAPVAVFVLRDVSARKRREEQITRATAILESLYEVAPDGLLIVDERGAILRFNERFARMWRIPDDVLATRSDEEALKSVLSQLKDPEAFLQRVQQLYCDREATCQEELELADGRVFDRFTAPILGANGVYYGRAWFFRDVTERKASEKALETKSAELARSNADLQQFASAASHDLMEPLRKISAFGDLLRRRAGDKLDDSAREFLDRMQSAAVRMGTLIEDLLRFSRVFGDARPYERVDLARVAREVSGDLERALKEARATVEIGALPTIEAHPSQMRQLFQNLIANSLKFRQPDAPPRVTISARTAKSGFIELVFEDNGIGFEPKFAEKIFEPFMRLHTRQEYPGTGLGLAICRRILQRHGGWITASSEPGRGARFVVTLPAGRGS